MLLGLATGSLTALVALSLVIVHRVSGVLNFAAAALGAVGAFVCYSLRDDHGWPTPIAVARWPGRRGPPRGPDVPGDGGAAEVVAARPVDRDARAAELGRGPHARWSGRNQLSQPVSFLPTRDVVLTGDVRIAEDRLILIGLAVVLALVLWAIYSRSLFGLATSAVSESRRVAAIAGWAPARVELVNYLIAGFLSALAAILLAPIVTLNAAILSVAVLPALAAALVGRFSSFGLTVAAALVIGVLQSELSLFQPDIANAWHVSTASLTGLPQAVPLLIILVVAVASGRARPARGETSARLPLPGSGRIARVPLALAHRGGRRTGLLGSELLERAHHDIRHRHHHRVGRRRVGLRRPALALPVRAGRFRCVGRGSGGQQPRRALPGRRADRGGGGDRGRRARRPACDPYPRGDARHRDAGALAGLQRADLRELEHDGRIRRASSCEVPRSSATSSIRCSIRSGTQRSCWSRSSSSV